MSDSTLTAAPAVSFARNAAPADYFALLKPRVMSLVVFTAKRNELMQSGNIRFNSFYCRGFAIHLHAD